MRRCCVVLLLSLTAAMALAQDGFFMGKGAPMHPLPLGVWRTIDPGAEGLTFAWGQHPVSGVFMCVSDMSGSLLRSTDGGLTYHPLAPPRHPTISTLVPHPTQAGRWYAGFRFRTVGEDKISGVYVTDNDGETWQELCAGYSVSRIGSAGHVIPGTPDTIVWLDRKDGLLLSRDGGHSFAAWAEGLPDPAASENDRWVEQQGHRDMIKSVGAGEQTVVYVVWHDAIYRRAMTGARWEPVPGLPKDALPLELACEPARGVMWCCFAQLGVFRGDLKSDTWTRVNDQQGLIIVRTHPQRPGWVWARTAGAEVVRSTDDGSTWERLTRPLCLQNDSYQSNMQRRYRYGYWGNPHPFLFIGAKNPDLIFLADTQLSRDGGKTWALVSCLPQEGDGSWRSNGLTLLTDYEAWFDPFLPNRIFLGFSDTGFMRSENRGYSVQRCVDLINRPVSPVAYWMAHQLYTSGSCMAFAADPDRPGTCYYAMSGKGGEPAGVCGMIFKTTNDGRDWDVLFPHEVGLPNGIITKLLLRRGSRPGEQRLYALVNAIGGSQPPHQKTGGLYESTDGGHQWRCLADLKAFRNCLPLMDVVACEDHPAVMVLCSTTGQGKRPGTSFEFLGRPTPDSLGGVFRSEDAGRTWQPISDRELPNTVQVAIHPHDPNVLFAAAVTGLTLGEDGKPQPVKGGIVRSRNGGKSWQRVLAEEQYVPAPVQPAGATSVVIHPLLPNVVYAAINLCGVFRSTDSGDTWQRVDWEHLQRYQGYYHTLAINPHDPTELILPLFGNAFLAYRDPALEPLLAQEYGAGHNLLPNGDFALTSGDGAPTHWQWWNPQMTNDAAVVSVAPGPDAEHGAALKLAYSAPARLDPQRDVTGFPPEVWATQRLTPYAVQLLRGKQVKVSADLWATLPLSYVPYRPSVELYERRDGFADPVVEMPLSTFAAQVPAGAPKAGRWLKLAGAGQVSERAQALEIVIVSDRRPTDQVYYVDNVRVELVE